MFQLGRKLELEGLPDIEGKDHLLEIREVGGGLGYKLVAYFIQLGLDLLIRYGQCFHEFGLLYRLVGGVLFGNETHYLLDDL